MAAPITHVVLTDKIFSKHFSEKDKKKFFIGTLFPDIRYLGVIQREQTHFKNSTLEEIKNEESFLAGVKFHSLLDINREKFITEHGIYSYAPSSPYITQAIKFLEDQLFYNKILDWNIYIEYFETILSEETEWGIEKDGIEKWHNLLKKYFSKPPTLDTVTDFVTQLKLRKEGAQEINKLVEELKENKAVIDIINKLYSEFPKLSTLSTNEK